MSLEDTYRKAEKNLVEYYRIFLAGDGYVKPAPFHYELSEILLNGKGHFATESFRESAKSSYVLQAYPLYCLTYPKEERSYIIIIKQNQRLAEAKLKEIADTYVNHPILKNNLIRIKEQSVKVFECVVWGVGKEKITMRFEAYGKGSALRGLIWGTKRPQIVIGDDLQDLEDSISDVIQAKDWDWFLADIKPLGKNTRIFIIGNNLGERCLIEKIFFSKKSLEFETMRVPAIDHAGEPTWKEQFTLEFLLKEKAAYVAMGKIDIWYKERMCIAQPEETRVFKKEYIKYFNNDDIANKNLKYYIAVDPAISMKKTADNTAVVVVGKEETSSKWYVVELIAKKMNPSEIIDLLFHLYHRYKPVKIGIETVAYQQALEHFFREEMSRRGVYPIVEGLKHTTNKEERIKGLEPMFRCGDIFIRDTMIILEEELLSFPMGAHDDTIDSLAMIKEIITITDYNNVDVMLQREMEDYLDD